MRIGSVVRVPIITGDTMRHGLREAGSYALLSAALRLGVQIGFNGGVSDPYQQFRRAIALADRAVELDPGMADGYAARGMARVWGYAPKVLRTRT